MFTRQEKDTLVAQSLETILWQAADETGALEHMSAWDATAETVRVVTRDILDFCERIRAERLWDITMDVMSLDQLAHDYWLTRNHHGVGFWDRGLGRLGDSLTDLAQLDREYDVFAVDNSGWEVE